MHLPCNCLSSSDLVPNARRMTADILLCSPNDIRSFGHGFVKSCSTCIYIVKTCSIIIQSGAIVHHKLHRGLPFSFRVVPFSCPSKLHLYYPFFVRASPPVPLISYPENYLGLFQKDPSCSVPMRTLYCPANQPNFCFLTLGKTPINVMAAATSTAHSLI